MIIASRNEIFSSSAEIITKTTVTGASFQLAGYFLKEVLMRTENEMAIIIDIKVGDIYINKTPKAQPVKVFITLDLTASSNKFTSGSVTTITEINAKSFLLSGKKYKEAQTMVHPATMRKT